MAIALHSKLNARILEELRVDNTNLLQQDNYLFQRHNYLELQASSKEDKQTWLKLVDLARKAVHFAVAPIPHLAVLRSSMQNYLN